MVSVIGLPFVNIIVGVRFFVQCYIDTLSPKSYVVRRNGFGVAGDCSIANFTFWNQVSGFWIVPPKTKIKQDWLK